jgi:hypothetical protein
MWGLVIGTRVFHTQKHVAKKGLRDGPHSSWRRVHSLVVTTVISAQVPASRCGVVGARELKERPLLRH